MQSSTYSLGRRTLLALAGAWGLATAAQAQAPANDSPCAATVLTAQGSLCTAPLVSTNAGATTTAPNGYANPSATQNGCGGGTAPKDVWFAFTTAATGPASFGAAITVTGNPAGLVRVYSAASCAGPFTEIQCSSAGQANTVAPRLTTGALQANTTYYVQVAGASDSDPTGAFTICLTDGPGLPTCGTPTLGTPTYSSPTTATIPLTLGANNTYPVTVLVTGPGNFSQTTTASAAPIQLTGLTQGTAYTVRVTAPCAASNQTASPVSATISTPTRYCSTGLGGGCGTANITDVAIVGTSLSNLSQSPPCNAASYVNFPVAGSTTTTLTPGTPYQLSVKLASTSTGDNAAAWLDINQNGVFEASENIMPQGVANTFNARVVTFLVPLNALAGPTGLRVRSAYSGLTTLGPGAACISVLTGGETEDYTVTIGAAAACPSPSGLSVSNIGSSTATLTFTPVPGVTSYIVTYYSIAGTGSSGRLTMQVAGSPVQLTGLSAGSTSSATVVSNCGVGSLSAPVTVGFQMLAAPAANDDCSAATLLATGTNPIPITGTTNYGSVGSPNPAPTAACTVPVTQDSWYRFVATLPTHNVVVSIQEQGSILVDAFSGTCAGFVRLACTRQVANPNGNQTATLTLPLTGLIVGQTYYVRIGQATTAVYAYGYAISIQNPGTGYCITGLGGSATCAGPTLNSVAIPGTALNTSNTGCQQTVAGAYTEFPYSSGNTTATLSQGHTYQLQTGLLGPAADVSLWIDYNQNFVFEANEHLQVGLNVTGTATASFTVPATALAGPTRLRLRSRAAGPGNGPADACTNFTPSGETEDYTVTIALATATSTPALAALVSLAPNPAHHAATLRLPASFSRQGGTVRVLNGLGQTVRQQPLPATATSLELDLHGLPTGVYLVQLHTAQATLAKRLVVE